MGYGRGIRRTPGDLGIYYDEVDIYGVGDDFDNSVQIPYNKLIWQSSCIGFLQSWEWDGTSEDAMRLHALGVEMVYSDDFTADDVEGINV